MLTGSALKAITDASRSRLLLLVIVAPPKRTHDTDPAG
jgi:hypothetical protein